MWFLCCRLCWFSSSSLRRFRHDLLFGSANYVSLSYMIISLMHISRHISRNSWPTKAEFGGMVTCLMWSLSAYFWHLFSIQWCDCATYLQIIVSSNFSISAVIGITCLVALQLSKHKTCCSSDTERHTLLTRGSAITEGPCVSGTLHWRFSNWIIYRAGQHKISTVTLKHRLWVTCNLSLCNPSYDTIGWIA